MKKCIIPGCENTDDKGGFYLELCLPCYDYLAHNVGNNSQAQRNDEISFNVKKHFRSLNTQNVMGKKND